MGFAQGLGQGFSLYNQFSRGRMSRADEVRLGMSLDENRRAEERMVMARESERRADNADVRADQNAERDAARFDDDMRNLRATVSINERANRQQQLQEDAQGQIKNFHKNAAEATDAGNRDRIREAEENLYKYSRLKNTDAAKELTTLLVDGGNAKNFFSHSPNIGAVVGYLRSDKETSDQFLGEHRTVVGFVYDPDTHTVIPQVRNAKTGTTGPATEDPEDLSSPMARIPADELYGELVSVARRKGGFTTAQQSMDIDTLTRNSPQGKRLDGMASEQARVLAENPDRMAASQAQIASLTGVRDQLGSSIEGRQTAAERKAIWEEENSGLRRSTRREAREFSATRARALGAIDAEHNADDDSNLVTQRGQVEGLNQQINQEVGRLGGMGKTLATAQGMGDSVTRELANQRALMGATDRRSATGALNREQTGTPYQPSTSKQATTSETADALVKRFVPKTVSVIENGKSKNASNDEAIARSSTLVRHYLETQGIGANWDAWASQNTGHAAAIEKAILLSGQRYFKDFETLEPLVMFAENGWLRKEQLEPLLEGVPREFTDNGKDSTEFLTRMARVSQRYNLDLGTAKGRAEAKAIVLDGVNRSNVR